ncbi:MAG TPA: GNAT family N-acetyltransferase [Acidobacteriaceae bacterium]|jgi:GNAT superfamily N-acetyltransferase|nr:GNAT family N-acetyltransferase [Acidobacteriaceae bacterium]
MQASGTAVSIREFRRGDEAAFRQLNEEWIARYFRLEPKDEETFADPWGMVVEPGGRILLATDGERAVGCCALVAMGDGEFEVAKMAVTAAFQGRGVGRLLLERTVAEARAMGVRRLYLETNHRLEPAIRLYRAVGFEDVPAGQAQTSPYARADVHMEMWL